MADGEIRISSPAMATVNAAEAASPTAANPPNDVQLALEPLAQRLEFLFKVIFEYGDRNM